MKCEKCGHALKPTDKKCPNCGAAVEKKGGKSLSEILKA